MSDEELLAELLLRWEELHEKGQEPSAEELCQDCPHLAPLLAERIQALKVTAWMERPDDDRGTQPDPSTPDAPRTLAGRYRLDEKIAEGGFAHVWKGFDLELRRAVAVKMPKAGRLLSTERFMAEARRVAGLKHPGVVVVFDVGRDGDSCFIVSEFVEGGSLADRIAKNRPTLQEAARLVAEVAETLAYAHRQGFIHRDIKPGNILIDRHGRALLADFGIARSPDDGAESGAVSFGTLAYMSPEQVEGQGVDHRADIYSLGVVLYEMLTGQLPHRGTDPVELRRQIVSGDVAQLPAVSKALGSICLKCLARKSSDRYHDAGKLAADLRRSGGSSRRSRLLVVGAAGLFLAAVVGLVIFLQHRPTREQPGDPGIVTKKEEGEQPAPGTLEAALALGKLHANKKEWDKAEAAFTEAIKVNPECAEAYHRRAGCLFNAGKVKESLPDFDLAARLDPKNAGTFKNRGLAYLRLLRINEAMADLRHAQELDPDHPDLYRKPMSLAFAQRGVVKAQANQKEQAIADMDEALRLDPTNAEVFDKRGSLHFNLKHFKEAVADFTEAIRLDPNQPVYYLHRGFAHESLGKKGEAAEDYKKGKKQPAPK
ncbi:MAG TPA: serine/threonine-protein kinase [Gemmataceae bacterium]|jgi:Flp pilus assembly protein TadD/tRNA A-37 threonylcarbamoyl transferase component Bud32